MSLVNTLLIRSLVWREGLDLFKRTWISSPSLRSGTRRRLASSFSSRTASRSRLVQQIVSHR
ncbi:hypothetical protein JG688_00018343 [Phytophthora aleatoria]|uniref:Uncharacterized protein n=1 Tax=Phytophthora aleatoria TaxID=2496075 RepID=A0A8J5LXS6_9STRA|nr:hypothetical protein JG688_00018343 [Phytophthora aleatoria]